MNNAIRHSLKEVLQKSAEWKEKGKKLYCFYPMHGALGDGRLMLVGRALYGWDTQPFTAEEMESESRREAILEDTFQLSHAEQGCPIYNLHKKWQDRLASKDSKYNPRKSNFWSVGRDVVKHYSTEAEMERWQSLLYWTNLYKITSAEKRNPHGSLRKTIEESSHQLFSTEIETIRPQRVLFLTGSWWAESFVKQPNFRAQKLAEYQHVHQTGHILSKDGSPVSFVVADHPERKKRAPIVNEIVDAFDRLKQI